MTCTACGEIVVTIIPIGGGTAIPYAPGTNPFTTVFASVASLK